MGLFPPLSTTSVSRIERELGGLEECVYCCGQYMVQLHTGWRSGISPTGYGIAGKPREGWVWPVKAQRGNMRARKDYYGGDAERNSKNPKNQGINGHTHPHKEGITLLQTTFHEEIQKLSERNSKTFRRNPKNQGINGHTPLHKEGFTRLQTTFHEEIQKHSEKIQKSRKKLKTLL